MYIFLVIYFDSQVTEFVIIFLKMIVENLSVSILSPSGMLELQDEILCIKSWKFSTYYIFWSDFHLPLLDEISK